MNLLSGRRAARSLLLAGVIVGLGIASVGVCVALLGGGPPFPVAVALTLLPVVLGAAATTSARARRAGTSILVAASDFAGLAIAVDLGLLLMLLAFGKLPIGAQDRPGEPGAAGHAARGGLRGAAGPADGRADPRGPARRAALARGAARRRRRERRPQQPGGRAAAPLAESMRRDWRLSSVRIWTGRRRAGWTRATWGARRSGPPPLDGRPLDRRRSPLVGGRARPARPRPGWPGPAGCGCGCHGCCGRGDARDGAAAAALRARRARRPRARAGGRRTAADAVAVHRGGRARARRRRAQARDRAAQPQPGRGAAGHARRPADEQRRAAGVPRAARRRGDGRAAADRTRPARRRPAAPRRARGRAAAAARRPAAATRRDLELLDELDGGVRAADRRAAQPRARHLPAAAARRRAGRGAARGRGSAARSRHGGRRTAGPPPRAGRGGGVLLLPGGAAERGEARAGRRGHVALERCRASCGSRSPTRARVRPGRRPRGRGPDEHGRPARRGRRRGHLGIRTGSGTTVTGRAPVPSSPVQPGPAATPAGRSPSASVSAGRAEWPCAAWTRPRRTRSASPSAPCVWHAGGAAHRWLGLWGWGCCSAWSAASCWRRSRSPSAPRSAYPRLAAAVGLDDARVRRAGRATPRSSPRCRRCPGSPRAGCRRWVAQRGRSGACGTSRSAAGRTSRRASPSPVVIEGRAPRPRRRRRGRRRRARRRRRSGCTSATA